jgi:hypothetical protein
MLAVMYASLIIAIAVLLPVSAWADGGAPTYLFNDWRYWTFLLLYALLTVRLVTWLRRLADRRDAKEPFPLRDVSWASAFVLFNGLIYQGLHHYEHVSQIFQYWYLGEHRSVSKGIIFFLDLEWNHFIFDTGYLIILAAGCWLFARQWTKTGHKLDDMTLGLMAGTLCLQGWHAVEHTYRIIRHVRTGCEPCSGIADTLFNLPLIPLHFWFNVFAFTFPLLLFYWLRMDRLIGAFFRELKERIQGFLRPPALPQSSETSS